MKIDKSYILLLIMEYLNQKEIRRIPLSYINQFIDVIKTEIYTNEELTIDVIDDIEEKTEALEQCLSLTKKQVTMVLPNKMERIRNLWKLKQGNAIQDYFIFDSLFTECLNSENVKDFLEECKDQRKEAAENAIKKAINFYNELMRHYRKMIYAEKIDDKGLYNTHFCWIKDNLQIRKKLLDDIAYNFIAIDSYKHLMSLNTPNFALTKLDIDLEKNIELLLCHICASEAKEQFVTKGYIVDNNNLEYMGLEIFELNIMHAVYEMFNANKFKIDKKELISLKYQAILNSSTYEKKFITNDETLFTELDFSMEEYRYYKNHPFHGDYKKYITAQINILMEQEDKNYKNDSDYAATLYGCAVIQGCIQSIEEIDAFGFFQNEMLKHKNYNNPKYSISKYMLEESVHQKEKDPKELKKVDN